MVIKKRNNPYKFFLLFYVNKSLENVNLLCDAFYIGSLAVKIAYDKNPHFKKIKTKKTIIQLKYLLLSNQANFF